MEEATSRLITAQARRLGASRLVGEYRPKAKNGMVREHYFKLGFTPLATGEDGTSRAFLNLTDLAERELPMAIREG